MKQWELIAKSPQLLRIVVEDGWIYKADTTMIFVPFPMLDEMGSVNTMEQEQDAYSDAQRQLKDWK